MENVRSELLTIGHSNHSYEHFLQLLRANEVTAVADVRSSPFSRHFPHFDDEVLKKELRLDGVSFSFLGRELGGRPRDKSLYCDGVANYEKMAETLEFRTGLARIVKGSRDFRIALMCSERDPLDCHRCLLVARALADQFTIAHILADGIVVEHRDIEEKLLKISGIQDKDLFATRAEQLSAAYKLRAAKVAFSEPATEAQNHLETAALPKLSVRGQRE